MLYQNKCILALCILYTYVIFMRVYCYAINTRHTNHNPNILTIDARNHQHNEPLMKPLSQWIIKEPLSQGTIITRNHHCKEPSLQGTIVTSNHHHNETIKATDHQRTIAATNHIIAATNHIIAATNYIIAATNHRHVATKPLMQQTIINPSTSMKPSIDTTNLHHNVTIFTT